MKILGKSSSFASTGF